MIVLQGEVSQVCQNFFTIFQIWKPACLLHCTSITHNDYLEQLLTPKFALQVLSGQCLLADLFLVLGTSGLPDHLLMPVLVT